MEGLVLGVGWLRLPLGPGPTEGLFPRRNRTQGSPLQFLCGHQRAPIPCETQQGLSQAKLSGVMGMWLGQRIQELSADVGPQEKQAWAHAHASSYCFHCAEKTEAQQASVTCPILTAMSVWMVLLLSCVVLRVVLSRTLSRTAA